jgi:hypothetical protein
MTRKGKERRADEFPELQVLCAAAKLKFWDENTEANEKENEIRHLRT